MHPDKVQSCNSSKLCNRVSLQLTQVKCNTLYCREQSRSIKARVEYLEGTRFPQNLWARRKLGQQMWQNSFILSQLLSNIPILGVRCQKTSREFPQIEHFIPPWSRVGLGTKYKNSLRSTAIVVWFVNIIRRCNIVGISITVLCMFWIA